MAADWSQEVGALAFEHVISPGREGLAGPLYQALALRRSVAGVWQPSALEMYGDVAGRGEELHSSKGQDTA